MKHLHFAFFIFFILSCSSPVINNMELNDLGDPKIKIVHVSDLHIKNQGTSLLDNTFSKINSLSPDLVLFTGDLVESNDGLEVLNSYLSSLTIDVPMYACLGNWEHGGVDLVKYNEILAENGIILLVNQGEEIEIDTRKINLWGVDDSLTSYVDFSDYEPKPDSLNLFLSHCPDIFTGVCGAFEDNPNPFVMLSGHTHGGQITFFGKAIITPPGSGDYVNGLYSLDNNYLIVTKGIGNSTIDIRIFADPEIMLYKF